MEKRNIGVLWGTGGINSGEGLQQRVNWLPGNQNILVVWRQEIFLRRSSYTTFVKVFNEGVSTCRSDFSSHTFLLKRGLFKKGRKWGELGVGRYIITRMFRPYQEGMIRGDNMQNKLPHGC